MSKNDLEVIPATEGSATRSYAPCTVYEFRYSAQSLTPQALIDILRPIAKKFVFQLEKGDSGYLHYQGRLSLIKKRRKFEALPLFESNPPQFFEPTVSTEHRKNAFYVMKADTRVGTETYTETDTPPVITRQVQELGPLYPFQQQIVDDASIWNKRSINVVHCPTGNMGKTSLVQYCRAHKIGRPLPPVNDAKDLLRIVCNVPTSRMYLFDMPRAMKKEKLSQFFTAVESIKDGYAYDDRYEFTEKVFDCPNIWIFTNSLPETELLSQDRWKLWSIQEDKTLTPLIIPPPTVDTDPTL